MITLRKSLAAWLSPDFKNVFRAEVAALDESLLPLQQGLSYGNYADGSDLSVLVLNVSESNKAIQVKTGIFYQGFIAGCNCSDDPTASSEGHTEYCEVQWVIDKTTAEATVTLLS